ncbi:MAG: hypothetical protein AABX30_00010 [Nanoarchaeota archaeon]
MNKKAQKRLISIAGISIVLLIIGVFASSFVIGAENDSSESGLSEEVKAQIEDKLAEPESQGVSENVQRYVEEFVEKKKINPEQINNVSEVDFNALPKEVNIENVNDANLAIYEVNYNDNTTAAGEQKKVFVITYSTEKVAKQGDIIVAQDKREFLNFGYSGESTDSRFLNTAAGVLGSLEKGYVMMREGSITGISTNMEVVSGSGDIEIIIYKNGEEISFENLINGDKTGVQTDYDVQSKGVVEFEPGDVVSVSVKSGNVVWKDAIVMVEITTTK